MAGNEELVLNECPSKCVSGVAEFFHIHTWAERGRLQYLYPHEELPVIVGEALDTIESEQAHKEAWSFEKARNGRE